MGWTWEVALYQEIETGKYAYASYYTGESALKAFRAYWLARRSGEHCIQITWRR